MDNAAAALTLEALGELAGIENTTDDAPTVVENGIGPSKEAMEEMTAGTDELNTGADRLAAGIEELIARVLLGRIVELTIAEELETTPVDAPTVGDKELVRAVEVPAAAIVDDCATKLLAVHTLLTEFVGALGDPI